MTRASDHLISAISQTLVELAKLSGLNVLKYLTHLLEHRPNENMSDEELEEFMPWNENVISTC